TVVPVEGPPFKNLDAVVQHIGKQHDTLIHSPGISLGSTEVPKQTFDTRLCFTNLRQPETLTGSVTHNDTPQDSHTSKDRPSSVDTEPTILRTDDPKVLDVVGGSIDTDIANRTVRYHPEPQGQVQIEGDSTSPSTTPPPSPVSSPTN